MARFNLLRSRRTLNLRFFRMRGFSEKSGVRMRKKITNRDYGWRYAVTLTFDDAHYRKPLFLAIPEELYVKINLDVIEQQIYDPDSLNPRISRFLNAYRMKLKREGLESTLDVDSFRTWDLACRYQIDKYAWTCSPKEYDQIYDYLEGRRKTLPSRLRRVTPKFKHLRDSRTRYRNLIMYFWKFEFGKKHGRFHFHLLMNHLPEEDVPLAYEGTKKDQKHVEKWWYGVGKTTWVSQVWGQGRVLIQKLTTAEFAQAYALKYSMKNTLASKDARELLNRTRHFSTSQNIPPATTRQYERVKIGMTYLQAKRFLTENVSSLGEACQSRILFPAAATPLDTLEREYCKVVLKIWVAVLRGYPYGLNHTLNQVWFRSEKC